jgi:hypothetical protein
MVSHVSPKLQLRSAAEDVPSLGVTDSLLMEKSPDCCSSETLLFDKPEAEVDAMVRVSRGLRLGECVLDLT